MISGWETYLGAFLASMVASLAVAASVGLLWLFTLQVDPRALAVGGVGLGLLWLTAQLVRALLLGASLVQATARMRGATVPPLGDAVGEGASRSLSWLFYGLILEVLRSGWQLLTLGLAGFAYVYALGSGAHGVRSAAGLAIALTLAVALWIALALWVDYAFARTVVSMRPGPQQEEVSALPPQSFLAALFDSAGILWRAPFGPLVILVLTALGAGALELFAGLAPGQVGPGGVRGLGFAGALIGAAFVAFVDTGATLWRLGAFAVLELDASGQLPTPPRAEPIVEAQPVLEARPVEPGVGPSPA